VVHVYNMLYRDTLWYGCVINIHKETIKNCTLLSPMFIGHQLSNIPCGLCGGYKMSPRTTSLCSHIFWSSWIMECTCVLFTFENGVPVMRKLASVVWHHSLLLMISFNKPRLLFSRAGYASRGLSFSSV